MGSERNTQALEGFYSLPERAIKRNGRRTFSLLLNSPAILDELAVWSAVRVINKEIRVPISPWSSALLRAMSHFVSFSVLGNRSPRKNSVRAGASLETRLDISTSYPGLEKKKF